MSLLQMGPGGLDYFPCRYAPSKLQFRGPQRALEDPFIAFLGGSDTYGKFVAHPFPDLVEQELGLTCVNLGYMNAGIDVMLHDPFLRNVVIPAQVTVLQILSPRNMSNRFYTVHPRRNDRFIRPSTVLQAIYRDVDFSEFNFTRHMLHHLHGVSPERFQSVVQELRQAWRARMKLLLNQMPGKVVLLWVSDHAPRAHEEVLEFDPWFVSRDMIEDIQDDVSAYVEVVCAPDPDSDPTEGMIIEEWDTQAAAHVIGPAVHKETARLLAPVLKDLL